jgi:hypothetical protein
MTINAIRNVSVLLRSKHGGNNPSSFALRYAQDFNEVKALGGDGLTTLS